MRSATPDRSGDACAGAGTPSPGVPATCAGNGRSLWSVALRWVGPPVAVAALVGVLFAAKSSEDRLYDGPEVAAAPPSGPLEPFDCAVAVPRAVCSMMRFAGEPDVHVLRIPLTTDRPEERSPVLYVSAPGMGFDDEVVGHLDSLAEHLRRSVVVVDLGLDVVVERDLDGTPTGPGPMRQAERIEAVRRALSARAVVVVGEGAGTAAARAFVAAHPSRSEQLVEITPLPSTVGELETHAVPTLIVALDEATLDSPSGKLPAGAGAADRVVLLPRSRRASIADRCVEQAIGEFLERRAVTLAAACRR